MEPTLQAQILNSKQEYYQFHHSLSFLSTTQQCIQMHCKDHQVQLSIPTNLRSYLQNAKKLITSSTVQSTKKCIKPFGYHRIR